VLPELPVVGVRVARPTDRLEEVVAFYRDGLGLPVIDSFEGHAGYSGVMLGLPGASYYLEFTHHEAGSACPAPPKDNLLVLYLFERTAMERLVGRLSAMGIPSDCLGIFSVLSTDDTAAASDYTEHSEQEPAARIDSRIAYQAHCAFGPGRCA
jgi:hypothetical protein